MNFQSRTIRHCEFPKQKHLARCDSKAEASELLFQVRSIRGFSPEHKRQEPSFSKAAASRRSRSAWTFLEAEASRKLLPNRSVSLDLSSTHLHLPSSNINHITQLSGHQHWRPLRPDQDQSATDPIHTHNRERVAHFFPYNCLEQTKRKMTPQGDPMENEPRCNLQETTLQMGFLNMSHLSPALKGQMHMSITREPN